MKELEERYPALKPYPYPYSMRYDASDSSDDEDLYDPRTFNDYPKEVFDDSSSVCLNTLFGDINNDEPKMEPSVPPISVCYAFCFTNEVQESTLAKDKLLAPEGYYELYPHNRSQGKDSKIDHKPLTLSWQKNKNTCPPHLVHRLSLEDEDLFTYMMPMHRKQVQLRPNYDSKCSKPLLEARTNASLVDIY